MTDERYNEIFNEGYEACFQGEDRPPSHYTSEERKAWWDGWNTASEENDDD